MVSSPAGELKNDAPLRKIESVRAIVGGSIHRGILIALVALTISAALTAQCTFSGSDCRKVRDREVTCGLLAVDFARSCDTTARANGTSTASCTDPLLGAFLLCPLTVDEVCD